MPLSFIGNFIRNLIWSLMRWLSKNKIKVRLNSNLCGNPLIHPTSRQLFGQTSRYSVSIKKWPRKSTTQNLELRTCAKSPEKKKKGNMLNHILKPQHWRSTYWQQAVQIKTWPMTYSGHGSWQFARRATTLVYGYNKVQKRTAEENHWRSCNRENLVQ